MLNSTSQLKSAKDKKNVLKSTSIDAFIPASTITWVTANTDSAAISHTLSEDKSTDPSLRNKPAKNSITKTTAQMDQSADTHTISENTHVFTTQSPNANSPMPIADTPTKKNWMSPSSVFLILWEVALTQTAKMPITSTTSSNISPTMDLSEHSDSQTTFIISQSFFLFIHSHKINT